MKRIMVTGALGQIGSDLVAKLRQIYGEKPFLQRTFAKSTMKRSYRDRSKHWT